MTYLIFRGRWNLDCQQQQPDSTRGDRARRSQGRHGDLKQFFLGGWVDIWLLYGYYMVNNGNIWLIYFGINHNIFGDSMGWHIGILWDYMGGSWGWTANYKWGCPSMGVSQNRWFMIGTSIYKWMIGGYLYFRKPPYISKTKCRFFWFCFHAMCDHLCFPWLLPTWSCCRVYG